MLRLAENMYAKHCNIIDLFAGGALQTKLQNKQSIIYQMSHIKKKFDQKFKQMALILSSKIYFL